VVAYFLFCENIKNPYLCAVFSHHFNSVTMSALGKYVNPFTDFGFKRLFGEEAHDYGVIEWLSEKAARFDKTEAELTTRFEKWIYFLKNLEDFNEIPTILNEPIFQEAFEVARVANFDSKELDEYNESYKNYNDLNNVIDSAVVKAVGEAIDTTKKEIIIRILKGQKLSIAEIAVYNDVSVETVLAIQKEM
jgi:PD-(D/E)XK nuclease family transposase